MAEADDETGARPPEAEPTVAGFRHFADAIPQPAWNADRQRSIVWYNRRWYDCTGTMLDEMRGRGWSRVHPPDHVLRVVVRCDTAFSAGETWEDTSPMRRHDGAHRWFLSRAEPVRGADSAMVRWFGTNTDIAEERDAEAAVRRSEERSRTLISASADLVWTAGPDGGWVSPLPTWRAYTGQTEADDAGWGWMEVVHPDDRERVAVLWRGCLHARAPFHAEFHLRRRKGGSRYSEVRAVPVMGADGTMRERIGIDTDLSDRRRTGDGLRDSGDRAGSATRSKSRFIANTRHELRTPLSAVIGCSEMLAGEIEDVGQARLTLARALHPQAILLDVGMPKMDGWSVLHALRQDPALVDMPVVMVSVENEQSLAHALGATDDLPKPVEWDRLKRVMDRLQPHKDGTVPEIDDDGDTRGRIRYVLSRTGWSVVEAADGAEALERLDGVAPRLILLDLFRPVADGFAFLKRLRQRPDGGLVPVVVLTAKDVTPEERACLRGQAERIVAKGSVSLPDLAQDLRDMIDPVGR